MTRKKERRINVSEIWYGLPAEGILDLLGVSHGGNLETGTNILSIRQEEINKYPSIIFELSDENVMPFTGSSDIATADEMFDYFFDFKKLIEWTENYLDRVVKNRQVISNLKNALDSGRTIRSCERFQKQTELPIEESFSLMLDYPRIPPERYFWIVGGKEKDKNRGFKLNTQEYITSDEKKVMLNIPALVSEMPKYYYDPTSASNYKFTRYPEVKINNIRVSDTDILTRLQKNGEIHSTFFQDKFLAENALFNAFVVSIATKLKRVMYSTFPDCFFSEDIRKSSLLDLYFQSWASDTPDSAIMTFNSNSGKKHRIEFFITEKMEKEKDKIFKEGVNGSTWLSKTTLESLMQEFTHFVKQTSD